MSSEDAVSTSPSPGDGDVAIGGDTAGSELAVPDDRCGYTYDVSTLQGIGETTCWRPVREDDDRCVWHSDGNDKSYADYESQAPNAPERLDGAVITEISLDGVSWFEECTLVGSDLSDVDLRNASLVGTDFRNASFQHVDARNSSFLDANLEGATFDASDLRHVQFANARLDQTVFSNVRISRGTDFGKVPIYERELDASDDEESYLRAAQAAIWTNREIQALFERNALPLESRHYYLKEKDVRRRLAWHVNNYAQAFRAEGSRWVTGYGMSPWRVLATSLVVIVVSALIYPLTGGLQEVISAGGEQVAITWEIQNPEGASRYHLLTAFLRSLYFSVVTFTTLGYGDISPVGSVARTVAGVEALMGTALMALLVFVLSRRIQ